MSSSQRMETRMVGPNNRQEALKLRSVLFDTETPLTLSPMQIYIFSMGFIFMVFMLHIIGKIFPSVSPIQLFVAILMISVSAGISLNSMMRK